MRPRAAVATVVVVILVVLGAALVPRVSSKLGYATPFGPPAQFSYDGRDYVDPRCAKPYPRDLPLRQIGSVRGFLTGSKPIYRPHSMPKGLDPTYLYVQAGCLRAYDLSGGP